MQGFKAIFFSAVFILGFSATAPSVLAASSKCTAGTKSYAKDWIEPSPPSLLGKCALGSLISFNILSEFDPFAILLDIAQKRLCGLVKDLTNPYIQKLNDGIEGYNETINGINNYTENEFRDSIEAGLDEAFEGREGTGYRETYVVDPPSKLNWPPSSWDENMKKGGMEEAEIPQGGIALKNGGGTVIVAPSIGDGKDIKKTKSNTRGRLIQRGGDGVLDGNIAPVKSWDEIYQGIVE